MLRWIYEKLMFCVWLGHVHVQLARTTDSKQQKGQNKPSDSTGKLVNKPVCHSKNSTGGANYCSHKVHPCILFSLSLTNNKGRFRIMMPNKVAPN